MDIKTLAQLKKDFLEKVSRAGAIDSLRQIEIFYLGRNGKLTTILRSLKTLSSNQKKIVGNYANIVKKELEEKVKEKFQEFQGGKSADIAQREWIDSTMPNLVGIKAKRGRLHPIIAMQYQIEDIFTSMGFMVLDGPELESEYYAFEALNIPEWHPARDMQDTFYLKSQISLTSEAPLRSNIARMRVGVLRRQNLKSDESLVLRPHTSSVQVRAMRKHGAPIRAIAPGRVFRSEATDASHETTFYQIEGLMVDKDISVAHLIAVVQTFLQKVFNGRVDIRVRPGYFPFVEPGMEVDLRCLMCDGKGCGVCKYTGFIEFMGCGMVHPYVLKAGNINPEKFQGFAFGFGLDRLVMLKYGIDDIRLFMSGDLRFLEQF